MRISRPTFGRLALLTALLTIAGGYGYYYGREFVAKWAFAHQTYFAADELILIAVPQTNLSSRNTYLVEEGEFEWHGQMVDVLHREVRSDTLYIYGFRDVAETDLKREAAWLYRDPTQPDRVPNPRIKRTKWLSPFILPPSVSTMSIVGGIVPKPRPAFAFFAGPIPRPLLEIPSPPPNS